MRELTGRVWNSNLRSETVPIFGPLLPHALYLAMLTLNVVAEASPSALELRNLLLE